MELIGFLLFFIFCLFGVTFLMLFAVSQRQNLKVSDIFLETLAFFKDIFVEFWQKIKGIFKK